MPALDNHPLANMVETLAARTVIDDDDRAALLSLPYSIRWFEPGSYLVREGDVSSHCHILLDGFAIRQKIDNEGLRQIISILITDDVFDSENIYLQTADHSIQPLTRCKVALIPVKAWRDVLLLRPTIGVAIFTNSLVEASRYREWLLNIGRRDARMRVAHFLCELAVRLENRGLAPGHRYELPMTQEQLGEAVGLTSVHVNRTLKSLEKDGLIVRNRRVVIFPDWNRLVKVVDFNGRYLHLTQPNRDRTQLL